MRRAVSLYAARSASLRALRPAFPVAAARSVSTDLAAQVEMEEHRRRPRERTRPGMSETAITGPQEEGIGSASPWASDGWSAATVNGTETEIDESLLSSDAVAIPMDPDERGVLPSESDILGAYQSLLRSRSCDHMGYPYNLTFKNDELAPFMRYTINNLGDPFVPSNYGVHSRQFEVAVIDFFAKVWPASHPRPPILVHRRPRASPAAQLWKADSTDYWGYVTTCGTEGNLYGMLLGREAHPDGVIYASRETHYSIFKAANYYRMDCEVVPTLPTGEIDYNELCRALRRNRGRAAIMNVNIGTTVKGAVDDLDRILRVLDSAGYGRDEFYVHCDGALFAMMMPFVDYAPQISFDKPIDSIAVSGHKMLGCPMPCGVALTRKSHVRNVEQRIEYLNSVDTTIMGSRNGHAALHMWHALRSKGFDGVRAEVRACMSTAAYLNDELAKAGIISRLNDLSSTVVLERPNYEPFVQKWQLACEQDIAHVVVMPNVTEAKVDAFVAELVEVIRDHGRTRPLSDGSPLSIMSSEAWGGKTW